MTDAETPEAPFDPTTLTRPDRSLLTYYIIVSLFSGPLFPLVFLPLYFKYRTLRYVFDDDGVSMSWGLLSRREINLTYRRIQDIHVTRGLIQRKLNLAKVSVQTASAGSGPEMEIEGVHRPERLRDFLYSKMRGARTEDEGEGAASADEALQLLQEIRDALASIPGRERA